MDGDPWMTAGKSRKTRHRSIIDQLTDDAWAVIYEDRPANL